MAISQYSKVTSTISKAITKYGRDLILVQKLDPTTDPITRTTSYNTISIPITGIVKDFSVIFMEVGNVLQGDKNIRIAGNIGKPSLDDEISFNGDLYKIIDTKEMSPGGIPLFYDLHVRRYTVAEQPGAYIPTIGTLKVGTIITDPFKTPYSPSWMVLAHDHHDTGITTLMASTVTNYISFDGTQFTVPYYPSTPWNDTYMYEYLHNGFMSDFMSADIQEILQTVPIETQGNVTNDKISLLSKEELFGTYVVASSGSHIPYFNSNARRICFSSAQEAAVYWTRDIVSGTAPNWIISCVSATGTSASNWDYTLRGNRPIIFINKNQKVVINSKGIYEFKY